MSLSWRYTATSNATFFCKCCDIYYVNSRMKFKSNLALMIIPFTCLFLTATQVYRVPIHLGVLCQYCIYYIKKKMYYWKICNLYTIRSTDRIGIYFYAKGKKHTKKNPQCFEVVSQVHNNVHQLISKQSSSFEWKDNFTNEIVWAYRCLSSFAMMQLVLLCFQVMAEGLLEWWSYFGYRPGKQQIKTRDQKVFIILTQTPLKGRAQAHRAWIQWDFFFSLFIFKQRSQEQPCCTRVQQEERQVKHLVLSPSFYTPWLSSGTCVSPFNREVTRHDVITLTTHMGAKTSNQGILASLLGRVCYLFRGWSKARLAHDFCTFTANYLK